MDGPYDDEPAATATVGDPSALSENDRPHSIVVWNDGPWARTIGVRLVGAGDEPVIQRRYDLGPDGYVEWSLALTGYFEVEVAIGGGEFETADAEISPSLVDCNGSSTFVRVGEDGELDSATTTTLAACQEDVPNRTVGTEVTTTDG